jgi:hypothetical protein
VLIPESGAGYSRVTHPFATDRQEQAPVSPFDLHVLSTPPAFILSQDQTLHKCLTARQQAAGTSSATPDRNRSDRMTSLKLTRTNQTDSEEPDWTCFVLFISISKGIRQRKKPTPKRASPKPRTGFWHLTLCTLLSSQGSDAPGFHHKMASTPGPTKIRKSPSLSRRATCLTYHLRATCQVGGPRLESHIPRLDLLDELDLILSCNETTSKRCCLLLLGSGPT